MNEMMKEKIELEKSLELLSQEHIKQKCGLALEQIQQRIEIYDFYKERTNEIEKELERMQSKK